MTQMSERYVNCSLKICLKSRIPSNFITEPCLPSLKNIFTFWLGPILFLHSGLGRSFFSYWLGHILFTYWLGPILFYILAWADPFFHTGLDISYLHTGLDLSLFTYLLGPILFYILAWADSSLHTGLCRSCSLNGGKETFWGAGGRSWVSRCLRKGRWAGFSRGLTSALGHERRSEWWENEDWKRSEWWENEDWKRSGWWENED